MLWYYRIAQWLIAIHAAKQRVPWFGLIKIVFSGPVPRRVWRERLRYGCYQCELFNKKLLTCRGTIPPYSSYGCDCFLPFSCLFPEPHKGGCYGRERFGPTFGWGAYRMGRWERLWSPIRFLLRR